MGREIVKATNYDLHTHTTFSDGAHELPITVKFAEAVGLDAVAITDHFAPGGRLFEDLTFFRRYIEEIRRTREWAKVAVLAGVEATALDIRGKVSVTEGAFEAIDVVLADIGFRTEGVYKNPPSSKSALISNFVECTLRLCQSPLVHVIAHPFNAGRLSEPLEPADFPETALREVACAMREGRKAFEVMNCMFWWFPRMDVWKFTEQYARIVAVFAEEGVRFTVGSDDHRTGVGNLAWSRKVLELAGVRPEQIVSPEEFL